MVDWARLPGKLRDEILQGAADDSPEEYRELVKRYFQELAKRGSEQAPSGAAAGGGTKKGRSRP